MVVGATQMQAVAWFVDMGSHFQPMTGRHKAHSNRVLLYLLLSLCLPTYVTVTSPLRSPLLWAQPLWPEWLLEL
jgi:hypothetical protein